jgi:hypothetical protein
VSVAASACSPQQSVAPARSSLRKRAPHDSPAAPVMHIGTCHHARARRTQDPPGDRGRACGHPEPAERLLVVPDLDRYVTLGRDAALRAWQPADLALSRTVVNGDRWLVDAVYLRKEKQMVVASLDRSLTWYSITRGAFEAIGRCGAASRILRCCSKLARQPHFVLSQACCTLHLCVPLHAGFQAPHLCGANNKNVSGGQLTKCLSLRRRLHATPAMGMPTCLGSCTLPGHRPESVMYGDTSGLVHLMLADTSLPFPSRDMLYTEHTHDYVCLHDKHSDWVTKVSHVDDVGLVTSSLDAKIVIFDIQRCGAVVPQWWRRPLLRCSSCVSLARCVGSACRFRSGWCPATQARPLIATATWGSFAGPAMQMCMPLTPPRESSAVKGNKLHAHAGTASCMRSHTTQRASVTLRTAAPTASSAAAASA